MEKDAKIYVAGHRGLVGSAIVSSLERKGYTNLLLRTRDELDLKNSVAVEAFFSEEKPEYVFLAAAKVGGIVANNVYRADFIYENLMIQNNVIHQSHVHAVKKLLFLGSTCIYPKEAPQPMKEDSLLTGVLEYTNEPYAIAKIAGIKMCESYNLQYGTNFLAVQPTNLYGINDNFDLEKSHVLPALIRKMHLAKLLSEGDHLGVQEDLGVSSMAEAEAVLNKYGVNAKSVEIWGSGRPMREFLWSADMAEACVHIMQHVSFGDVRGAHPEVRNTHINIGTGEDITIRNLAELVKRKVGFEGELAFNTDRPDGTLKKLTDVSKLKGLGWEPSVSLEEGIERLYAWYKQKKK